MELHLLLVSAPLPDFSHSCECVFARPWSFSLDVSQSITRVFWLIWSHLGSWHFTHRLVAQQQSCSTWTSVMRKHAIHLIFSLSRIMRQLSSYCNTTALCSGSLVHCKISATAGEESPSDLWWILPAERHLAVNCLSEYTAAQTHAKGKGFDIFAHYYLI